jgi:hypothetical protein
MVTLGALWLPILLSAVIVFVMSFLVWNVLPWHKKEWKGLPNEESVRQALKDIPAGMYHVPHPASPKEMKDPAFQRKCAEGPMVMMSVMAKGMPSLGKSLAIWFVFLILVSTVFAYVAGRTLPAGTQYLEVFRIVGTVAWLAYGAALVQQSVWFGQPWRSAFWQQIDALMYGLLTAGVFGWLWPAAAS